MRLSILALLALAPLAACSTVTEAVRGPELAPVGYPAPLVAREQPTFVSAREPAPQPASANSLWRTGARAFFIDQRANRVGDILTVQIDINDSAQTSNASNSSRTAGMSSGVDNFLGLETSLGRFFPGAFDPSNAINTNSQSSNQGSGAVTRSERISLTIAAVVTNVLPNGNMVIQGTQEVRTNAELRQLTVAGIVRPEDIQSDNTIDSSKIAQARIAYGGRGQITDVQQPRYGQQVMDILLPF